MQVSRFLPTVLWLALLVMAGWSSYSHLQLRKLRLSNEFNARRRLQILSDAIQDGIAMGKRLPQNERDLWEFLAGDSPIEADLALLCQTTGGLSFEYHAQGSNSFSLSYKGLHGRTILIFDGTNTTVSLPDWAKWQAFEQSERRRELRGEP